jgi:large repetitive protein
MHLVPQAPDISPMTRIPSTLARFAVVVVVSSLLPIALAGTAQAVRQKSIRINDASVVEGDAGQKSMTFTISWTGSKGGSAPSVHYATADGTASAGLDYIAKPDTAVTLTNGGCRCATVTVPILGDAVTEGTETFVVNLSQASGATIADAQGTGTIYDNEGEPSFVVTDVTDVEAAGTLSFSVLLTNAKSSTVGVDYTTADGSALAGSDYTTTSGTLTFSPNQTSKSVAITVLDDALAEDDETLVLDLTNPTGGPQITDAQGLGTIGNDDADPTVSVNEASVAEGDTGTTTLSLPVTLSGPSGREVDVDYATSDGTATAGADYTATSGTLVFAPGETAKQVDVTVTGDFSNEGDETFAVTLGGQFNADLGTSTATGTIANDDAGPQLTIADVTAAEGSSGTTPMTFTVTMTPASAGDVTVDYATADGTATAGSDYAAATGTLTIPAGQTAGAIVIDVAADTAPEAAETLTLTLSNPVGAKIVPPAAATGTIANDDKTPTAITTKLVKGASVIKAKGTIETAASGMKIKVSLLKRIAGKYRLAASKTVAVKNIGDHDGDGIADGTYLAAFARPAAGAYRFVVRYAGNATYAASSRTLSFKL